VPERTLSELVRAAARGDEAAWSLIVDRHSQLVWTVVRSHRLRPDDAADVFQTTWLRLVEHLGRLERPGHLPAWLVTTARRECLRLLRLRGREFADPGVVEYADEPDTGALGPEAALLVSEENAALARAFARLAERCQAILRLTFADPGPSYSQIAEILDIPVGSIGPNRRRCLDLLRTLLDTHVSPTPR
jgi:RNA polymerase sigma factor (sigma-70 family)